MYTHILVDTIIRKGLQLPEIEVMSDLSVP
jgi:hypothetical protein